MNEPLSDTVKLKVSGLPARLVNTVEGYNGKDLTIGDLRKLWPGGVAPTHLKNVGKQTWLEAKPILDSLGLKSPYEPKPPSEVSLNVEVAGRSWVITYDKATSGNLTLTGADLRALLHWQEQASRLPPARTTG